MCAEPAGGCWNERWLGMKDNCKLSDWVLIEWVSGWACESRSCSVCLFFFVSHRSSFHQRSQFENPDGRMKHAEGICWDVFTGYTSVFQSRFVLNFGENKQRLCGTFTFSFGLASTLMWRLSEAALSIPSQVHPPPKTADVPINSHHVQKPNNCWVTVLTSQSWWEY